MNFALVDCNNFYASCERVFNPSLIGRPLVILSNNDGCVIARSEEAKQLGIKMGAPAFKNEAFFRQHGVAVLSSNYALYGDMSARVMAAMRPVVSAMEVYSIDEAFLALDAAHGEDFAREIRARVRQWTGIPVSVGIAPTKTLAKLANRLAKKTPERQGVLDFTRVTDSDAVLSMVPCSDIWGIGNRFSTRLSPMGIHTARDLKYAEMANVRKALGVIGERLARELGGVSCLTLEEIPSDKKGIASAKSFGHPVETLQELEEALATYTARVGEKLRAARLLAGHLSVFVESNRFSATQPQYHAGAQTTFLKPTNQTSVLIAAALDLLRSIYRVGYQYKKTGLFVTAMSPEGAVQLSLFEDRVDKPAGRPLAAIVDQLNRKLGANTIRYASMGTRDTWAMRQNRRSRKFTTRWSELPVAKA